MDNLFEKTSGTLREELADKLRQLEQEIAQNAWLTVEADAEVLFDTPVEKRLPAAMRLLGIDFSRLSDAAGHA